MWVFLVVIVAAVAVPASWVGFPLAVISILRVATLEVFPFWFCTPELVGDFDGVFRHEDP